MPFIWYNKGTINKAMGCDLPQESEDNMGKIYDKDGNKMGVAGICKEIMEIATDDEVTKMSEAMQEFDGIKKPSAKLAHTFVEMYSTVSMSDERGARLRKLMAGIINKHQKSVSEPSATDMAEYQALVDYINGNEEPPVEE